jgi:hypothetical protein
MLGISPKGDAEIERKVRGKWSPVVAWHKFDVINTGGAAKNTLRVSTRGNRINAYINGEKLAGIVGHSPDGGGTIGLFAESQKANHDTWKFFSLRVTDPTQ